MTVFTLQGSLAIRCKLAQRLVRGSHTAAVACAGRDRLFFYLSVGDQDFRGQHQRDDRRSVLECETGDLRWINHTGLDHVAEVTGLRVEAKVFILGFAHASYNQRALVPGVLGDLAHGLFKRALYDVHPNGLIVVELELLQGRQAAQKSGAPTGDYAFLNCPGCVHGVLDSSLFLFQLGLSRRTHLDDRNAADEFGQTLLQLFLVVVRCSLFDLRTKLFDSAFNRAALTGARDDCGVVFIYGHLLGAAQFFDFNVLELYAEILVDGLPTGENGNVLEHRLAAVAEARGFHSSALQCAAQLVHHQGGQGFSVDVLRNDQQRFAHLGHLFEQGQQVLHRADLFFVDQNADIFQDALHAFRIGDEIRRKVAAVELHALDYFKGCLHRLGFLNSDDAVFADLLHGFGDEVADLLVGVGADCAALRDHVALHLAGELLDLPHGNFNGLIDAALERHRVCARGNRSYTLTEDCLGQHGRGGGAVASHIRGLGRNLAHHLCTHVL